MPKRWHQKRMMRFCAEDMSMSAVSTRKLERTAHTRLGKPREWRLPGKPLAAGWYHSVRTTQSPSS
eukprot:6998477-Prymnesium_polylepis.1